MPKYIDGEKLRNRISAEYTNCTEEFVKGFSEAFCLWNEELERMMNEESTVQEVKHGQWQEQYATGTFFCSECGNDALYSCIRYNSETTIKEVLSDYCPHCGAKMDGEK